MVGPNNSWNSDWNATKGSLLAGDNTRPKKLSVGSDGLALIADSASAQGVKYGYPQGSVVNPTLPLFQALKTANTANATGDGTNVLVVFNSSVINQTASYNAATGLFTAPTTGSYWFYSTVAALSFAAAHTTGYLIFYKNGLAGIEYVEYAVNPFAMRELTTGALNFWGHEIIPMTVGDTMQVNFLISGGAKTVTLAGNPSPVITTRFGGWLIAGT